MLTPLVFCLGKITLNNGVRVCARARACVRLCVSRDVQVFVCLCVCALVHVCVRMRVLERVLILKDVCLTPAAAPACCFDKDRVCVVN